MGPLTVTWLPSMVTSTPLGIGMGCLPIRDIGVLRYQTWQRISPPTRRWRASRSVMRPWLVERMAMPMPPSTRGTSVGLRVDPQAGLRDPPQSGDRALAVGRVLQLDLQLAAGPRRVLARRRSPRCSPRARGCCASASFSFDDGISTSSWNAMFAFRRRVSMSAIGSVIMSAPTPSPRRLRHAGDLAGVRHLAEADAAEPEALVDRARARPQRRHRVYPRTLNFGVRCCFWTSAFFAMCSLPLVLRRRGGTGTRARAAVRGPGRRWCRVVTMVMSIPRTVSILS